MSQRIVFLGRNQLRELQKLTCLLPLPDRPGCHFMALGGAELWLVPQDDYGPIIAKIPPTPVADPLRAVQQDIADALRKGLDQWLKDNVDG